MVDSARRASPPPYADGWPLVGSLPGLLRGVDQFLLEQHVKRGPIFRLRALHIRFIAMTGPEANLFVTREKAPPFRSLEMWDGVRVELGAKRFVTACDGPEHARFRKILQRGYSRFAAEGRVGELVDVVRSEMSRWRQNDPVPVIPAVKRIIAEQLGRVAASFSPLDHLDDLLHFSRTALRVRATGELPRVVLLFPGYRRAKARVFAMARRVIDEHRQTPPGARPADLIDDLLAAHCEDPGFLAEEDVIAATLGPFIAGLDTAANGLAFLMYTLHRHLDVLERARAEVDQVFDGGALTLDSLRQLDVLRRAVMETMRLHPIAPGVARTATSSFEFGGCEVPAGSRVFIGTTVSHRLPEFFPDPLRFDIDRFTPERAEHRRPGAYAPYGIGPHTCLGAGLSDVLLLVSAAAILRFARLEIDPGYELRVEYNPSPSPDARFALRFLERHPG